MADLVYNSWKMHLLSGAVNCSTATFKLMLASGAYSIDIDTHRVTGDISAEITSANYSQGGKLIPSTSVFVDLTDNEGVITGHNVTFTGITASTQYGIVYVSGASPDTNYLVGQVDFGAQVLTNSDLTITWNSEGIYNLG